MKNTAAALITYLVTWPILLAIFVLALIDIALIFWRV